MSELKKCEHCGGAVTLEVIDGRACIDDPTCERRHWEADVPCRYQGADGLVEWWNTRAERTCHMNRIQDEPDATGYVTHECDVCGLEVVYPDDCPPNGWCAGCGAKVVEP